MNRFTRRLEALEARAPKASDELRLTAGLTEKECAAAYGRLLRGESLESVFPDAHFEPDPEPDLIERACAGLTVHELSTLYARMIHCKGRDETRNLLRDAAQRNRSRRP
jgi:hypothetical protein